LADVRDIEALCVLIPEAKVQFQGGRHVRIVIVVTPRPSRFSNHHGEVIGRMTIAIVPGFVSERSNRGERGV